jgi:hypothetical protein
MIQESEQRLGHVDIPARSEAWSNFADDLHANEEISDWQVEQTGSIQIVVTTDILLTT